MTEPYEIERGRERLVLHSTKWGTALTIWIGGAAMSMRLSRGEQLALAMALTSHARQKPVAK